MFQINPTELTIVSDKAVQQFATQHNTQRFSIACLSDDSSPSYALFGSDAVINVSKSDPDILKLVYNATFMRNEDGQWCTQVLSHGRKLSKQENAEVISLLIERFSMPKAG